MKRLLYILVACTIGLSSCQTTRQLAQIEQRQAETSQQLDSMRQQMNQMQQQINQLTQLLSKQGTTPQTGTGNTGTATTPQKRDWTTCVMRGAKAKVTMGGKTYKSTCATQAVWDSIVVISIMPAFNIEIFRIEATPYDITVINKKDKEYYRATYAEINSVVRPFVTYSDLRNLASGKGKNVLTYSAKGGSASLEMTWTQPVLNQPLKVERTDLKKYTKKDIQTLLK